MYAYAKETLAILNEVLSSQEDVINELIERVLNVIQEDKMIHVFGTGHSHMVGIEVFVRAGGLANVNAMLDFDAVSISGAIRGSKIERLSGISSIIYEDHQINEGDLLFIVSNSGRNAMPIEMALKAKEQHVTTIAITSMQQTTMQPSRHASNKNLYQLVDYVLDNGAPNGDGVVSLSQGVVTGGVSTISGMFLLHTILTEAVLKLDQQGVKVPMYTSQNVDGYQNDDLFKRYKGRVKFL